MAYSLSGKAGIDYTATNSVPEHPVGLIDCGSDGTVFQYVQAASAITAGMAVIVHSSATASFDRKLAYPPRS